MLDFRIHTFLCVCRHMNYTRAAVELHITQPAVSQHIRYLEREYGAKLLVTRGNDHAVDTSRPYSLECGDGYQS